MKHAAFISDVKMDAGGNKHGIHGMKPPIESSRRTGEVDRVLKKMHVGVIDCAEDVQML